MRKIFLIGYMGSGKTTIGRRLAQELDMQFVDLDLFLENRYRKNIPDIFNEKGEDGFREIERLALLEVASFENVLISTGGGTPCFFDNMEIMNNSGITIYLKVHEEELVKRLNLCRNNRPLIKDKTPEELISYVQENLSFRESYYMQANITVNSLTLDTVKDVELITKELITYLKEFDYDYKRN